MSADMSNWNIVEPTIKEFKQLNDKAQRIFYVMKTERATTAECYAARAKLANEYMRYKKALLASFSAA